MRNILIALSFVVATSSAAFATNSFGDGSPSNNANSYSITHQVANAHNTSNGSFQAHFGDGSPDNQQN